MAMRVCELALELEIETGNLLGEIEKLGISVRNHMSRIKDDEIAKVYERYKNLKNAQALKWAAPQAAQAPAPSQPPVAEPVISEEHAMRIKEAHARADAAVAVADAKRKQATAIVERHKAVQMKKAAEESTEAAAAKPAAAKPAAVKPIAAPAAAKKTEPHEGAARPKVGARPTRPAEPGAARPLRPAEPGAARPMRPGEPGAVRPARPTRPGEAVAARPARPGEAGAARPARPAGRGGERPERPGRPEERGGAPTRPGDRGRGRERAPEKPGERPQKGRGGRREPGQDEETPLDLSDLTIEVMKLSPEGGKRRRSKDKKKTSAKIYEDDTDLLPGARKGPRTRPGRPASGAPGRRIPIGAAKPRSLVIKKPLPKRVEMPHPILPIAKKIITHGAVTLGQMAEKMRLDASELIKKTLMMGAPLAINDIVDNDLIELLAMEFGFEVEIIPDTDESDVAPYMAQRRDPNRNVARPPVVTIMGHVDHGKTSLLEQIAKLELLDAEFGGITQHIAAYHVHTPRGEVIFLDTPGHAAFTQMRMRGGKAADIVALVVAADDGVMPQTIEAINHARAANAPIVVAINKIDKPGADPQKVKQQLMAYQLLSEELGGDTLFVEISAKKGINIDAFLEALLLQAEILELQADPEGPADGIVLEAMRDQQRGIEATVLIQQGTLRRGDVILAGRTFGRIRTMLDNLGRTIEEARPSFPARVYGLSGEPPEAGEAFLVLPDEREARQIAEKRADRRRNAGLSKRKHISLEGLKDYLKDHGAKELRVILKADVQGSLEAIEQSFKQIPGEKVRLSVLHSAVGAITESDVRLAAASDAVIIGFSVRPDSLSESLAQQEGIEIKCYNIIYDLLGDVRSSMLGLLDVKYREQPEAKAKVLQTFKVSKVGTVAGCFVEEGEIRRNSHARLVRDGSVVWSGKIGSLRRVKDAVERVQSGVECGIGLENFNDVKTGDVIETYTLIALEKTLE
ncbi:MAG: translation initiation factor IF-2 [Candidatus Sumerlaeota bacterium]|nr:translation initiation factor IF-2 [Candidatus Sumerlaeota bacterium]